MHPGPDGSPPLRPVVPAKRLADRYVLTRRLGSGAMGAVWEAHDEHLDRLVAIKRVTTPTSLPRSELEQVRTRAFREARAIASVADPHVVTVHDLLEDADGPAIVMEYLDATSIAEIIATGGPLTESQTITIGLAITSALMAAHAAGVTHRDVKPGNVLLCRDGRIKLTDFGIARSASEQTLTAQGLLLGSPAYISPEVASGKPAGPVADIWGLGALLFACVEGRPPFDAGDPLSTLTSVVHDPVPPAPAAGRLTALIGSLMQKDPRRRMALGHAHRILLNLVTDPTSASLVIRVWGSLAVPGRTSRRRPLPPEVTSTERRPGRPQPAVTRSPDRPPVRPPAPKPPPAPEVLPPPPWAKDKELSAAAAQLKPLPRATGPRIVGRSRRTKIAAVVLATVLAAAGFFGVRLVGKELVAPLTSSPTTGQTLSG